MKKTLLEGIKYSNRVINDIIFMCETRTKPTYFTRGGKMSFQSIILFMLNFVRKSLQLELDLFFSMLKEQSITKEGFSQAREKISPVAFIKLADAITTWFYGDDDFKTFKGFRLLAVDGSVVQLNNSETLRQAFGYVENQLVKLARAKMSALFDIENGMIVTAKIAHYNASERVIAAEHISKLKEFGLKNDLIIFDRGYPSRELISTIQNNGIKYLMRVPSHFLKAINNAKAEDQIVKAKIEGKPVEIRVLRLILDSGIEETLITNICDPGFTVQDFKELYFKRWGIETKYDELKNRLQIENISGDSAIAVEQDFYASIYLSNMATLAKGEADEKIRQRNAGKGLKYGYKVNMNLLIGKLKNSLVLMMLEENPRKRTKMLNMIMTDISRNVIPIRPGRNKPRKKKLVSNKYSLNDKRCL
jgi:hypothetical protein